MTVSEPEQKPQKGFLVNGSKYTKIKRDRSAAQLVEISMYLCGCTFPIVKCILGTLDLDNWAHSFSTLITININICFGCVKETPH